MFSEKRSNVFESVLELSWINGVPYWTNLPFWYAAGEAELRRHWRGWSFRERDREREKT